MASILRRNLSQRFNVNRSWLQSLIQAKRSYYTGDRYQGYISFFQPEELFGFVVREDLPDREYYFHSTDLHTRNVPRVRPLQQVEFSIVEGRGGNFIARDLTGPNQTDLEFNHPNMRLPQSDRTQLLSDLPNGLHDRHKGVVVSLHADGGGGLIVPDRLNFHVVAFRMSELQTTGFERLDRFSEVEFFVRPGRFQNQRDRAICITRPGGGLITCERKDIGSRRRQLGSMYGATDLKARVPQEFQVNRQKGYINDYIHDKLFGFITPVDNPSEESLFIHTDDCHIAGKRFLRRFQEVEFVQVTDEESGRTKALHVTGPNQTVIHNISNNHYLPRDLTLNELEADSITRYKGSVMMARKGANWVLIKPNERGYKPVFAFKNNIQALGQRHLNVGDAVEFSVIDFVQSTNQDNKDDHDENDEHIDENTNEQNTRHNEEHSLKKAINVTTEGGYPIVCERFRYGRYLQGRINLPIKQSELPEVIVDKDQIKNGFIASYSPTNKKGTIEVEAPAGERYRRVKFDINDAILQENQDIENGRLGYGYAVKFNIDDYEQDEVEQELQAKGIELLNKKAINITSFDMDYLQMREFNINTINNNDNEQQQIGNQRRNTNMRLSRDNNDNNNVKMNKINTTVLSSSNQLNDDSGQLWGDDDDVDQSKHKTL